MIGFTSGRIPDAPANHVLLKNYSVVGVHWGASLGRDPEALRRTYDELCRQWEAGAIDPLVGDVVPLEEAARALARLGARGSVGKLVVEPEPLSAWHVGSAGAQSAQVGVGQGCGG